MFLRNAPREVGVYELQRCDPPLMSELCRLDVLSRYCCLTSSSTVTAADNGVSGVEQMQQRLQDLQKPFYKSRIVFGGVG